MCCLELHLPLNFWTASSTAAPQAGWKWELAYKNKNIINFLNLAHLIIFIIFSLLRMIYFQKPLDLLTPLERKKPSWDYSWVDDIGEKTPKGAVFHLRTAPKLASTSAPQVGLQFLSFASSTSQALAAFSIWRCSYSASHEKRWTKRNWVKRTCYSPAWCVLRLW